MNACISPSRRPKQELFKLAGMAGGIFNKKLDQLTKEERAIVSVYSLFSICAISLGVEGLPR